METTSLSTGKFVSSIQTNSKPRSSRSAWEQPERTPMAATAIETLLGSKNPDDVLKGIRKVMESRSLHFLDPLLKLAESGQGDTRFLAREAGGMLLKHYLITCFNKVSKSKLNQYVQLLRQYDSGAAESIAQELKLEITENRIGRMSLLSILDPELAARTISTIAWDSDAQIRSTAVKILGRLTDTENLSKIIKFLYDKDNRVIANTIETLESIGNQNMLGILMRFRNHPNNRVRANTLKALWNLGCKDIHGDIQMMLNSGQELMQASAVWLIGQIGKQDAEIAKLLDLVAHSESPLVVSNVVRSARNIGSPETQALLAQFQGKDLKEIQEKARDRLHEVRLDRDSKTRATAVKILCALVNPRDLSELLSFLGDPDQRVIANTIEALEALGNNKVVEYIDRFRGHVNNRVRANALKALWNYGVRDIVDDLRRMLGDKRELMRASAAWVIGEIGHEDMAIADLLKLVKKDKARIVLDNMEKAKRKINSAFRAGQKTVEEVLVETAKQLLVKECLWMESVPAILTDSLLAKAKDTIQKKGMNIERRLAQVTDIGLFKPGRDENGQDLLSVPDPDALDLFLHFYKSSRVVEPSPWADLSDGAVLLLNTILYISQKQGTVLGQQTMFPLKALKESEMPQNLSVADRLNELQKRGILDIFIRGNETFLLFQRDRLQQIVRTVKWLPKFKSLLEK